MHTLASISIVKWPCFVMLENVFQRYNSFTCQIVVKFTTADPGRKQEIVHEYHYKPLSASFI